MSDSTKLGLTYGILYLIGAIAIWTVMTVLFVVMVLTFNKGGLFLIIPIFFLIGLFLIVITAAIDFFILVGVIK